MGAIVDDEIVGYQQISHSASTAFTIAGTNVYRARVVVEDGDIRWRPDGATTAPTASVGFLERQGNVFDITQPDLAAWRSIPTGGTVKLSVLFFSKVP